MKHKIKMDCKVIISLLMLLCIIKTEDLLDPVSITSKGVTRTSTNIEDGESFATITTVA